MPEQGMTRIGMAAARPAVTSARPTFPAWIDITEAERSGARCGSTETGAPTMALAPYGLLCSAHHNMPASPAAKSRFRCSVATLPPVSSASAVPSGVRSGRTLPPCTRCCDTLRTWVSRARRACSASTRRTGRFLRTCGGRYRAGRCPPSRLPNRRWSPWPSCSTAITRQWPASSPRPAHPGMAC
jgi:hypothetical protein